MHTIYKNTNGVEVPSVTTILKLLNKEKIKKWVSFLGFNNINYEDELAFQASIGTLAHKYIELFLNKKHKIFYSFKNDIEKGAYRAFINFLSFYNDNKDFLDIIDTEIRLTNDDFGGTVDCYCKYRGKYTIIDFKTSKEIHSTQFLQLAGYILLLEAHGYKVDGVAILSLSKKEYNNHKIRIIPREAMNRYIETFITLKDTFINWRSININEWGEDII